VIPFKPAYLAIYIVDIGKRVMCIRFMMENLMDTVHLGHQDEGGYNIKLDLKRN
jgi:hypothetical protein